MKGPASPLTVVCSHCHAAVGARCTEPVTDGMKFIEYCHYDRVRLATGEYLQAIKDVLEAVNTLGAADSAITTEADRQYQNGLDDVTEAIEAMRLQ